MTTTAIRLPRGGGSPAADHAADVMAADAAPRRLRAAKGSDKPKSAPKKAPKAPKKAGKAAGKKAK